MADLQMSNYIFLTIQDMLVTNDIVLNLIFAMFGNDDLHFYVYLKV